MANTMPMRCSAGLPATTLAMPRQAVSATSTTRRSQHRPCARNREGAVFDADMHHGHGTQEILYDRDDVLCVCIHGDPTNFYPGVAGFADEIGAGAGV